MTDPKEKSALKGKADAKVKKSPTKRALNTKSRTSSVDDVTFLLLAVNSFKSTPDYLALSKATGMTRKGVTNRLSILRNKHLPGDPSGMEGLKEAANPSKPGDNKEDSLGDSDEGTVKGDKE